MRNETLSGEWINAWVTESVACVSGCVVVAVGVGEGVCGLPGTKTRK